ncbi:hypothetical protein GCM10011506_09800 [Marivirga lumbricoides]|uniref:Chemotaxis protein n=1 Tax=Marivirga lumbricoides TaxID=1046115 RepID=A0A2T4DR30_9BACT|nr:chemotaxis protein [Marivirga lumbricoides]GGC26433.1 hypothetical protein GCM10011506_09800 [Marivirga lumbricoides]
MSIYSKIRWVASILLVFFIVLITNLVDKDNFNKLRYSVTTIYEDRVVASDLLFELQILIQEKEVALAISDSSFFEGSNKKVNDDIQALIESYEQTKLTREEQEILKEMKEEIDHLLVLEEKHINSNYSNRIALFKSIDEIAHNLYDLSKVQLKEGRRQMFISNKAMSTIDLFTQIEIIVMIVMAILIQIIIFYNPKQKKREE